MDLSAQAMVIHFAQAQLSQVLTAGTSLGLSPITTATCLLQITASALAGIAPAETAQLMRAYAAVIEAGPGDGQPQADARQAFDQAAKAFVATYQAAQAFPAPQGRA